MYCTLYTSSGDSRWHECGHATAFKSKWKSDALYQLASFMVFREPLVWRFSHARHHTDTDIVGRDPEIDGRPLDMWNLFLAFFNYQGIQGESKKIWMHAWGTLSPAERVFVPSTYRSAVYNQARAEEAYEWGYRFINIGSFVTFGVDGLTQALAAVRARENP